MGRAADCARDLGGLPPTVQAGRRRLGRLVAGGAARARGPAVGAAACLAALLLPGCLLVPESGLIGEPTPNHPPFCRITGGVLIDTDDPAQAAHEPARVHFYWFGSDDDGLIRYFEWAIDDTISADAWKRSEQYDETIPFPAVRQQAGSDFAEWHTFFVRAVDNEFSRSRPDARFFSAHTIAPDAEIILPLQHSGQNLQWSRTVKITWKGDDLDASRPDRLPAWFEYKWVRIEEAFDRTNLPQIRRIFAEAPNEFLLDSLHASDFPPGHPEYFAAALKQWVRVPGTTTETWLEDMIPDHKYGFVVRAVDEAGAVEPNLNWDNWTIFTTRDQNILVYLSEPYLGWHLFTTAEYTTWDVSVAPEQRFRFEWHGDASGAGTEPGPSNYGFDIPHPESEDEQAFDGIGGWIGWGERRRLERAMYFPRSEEGSTHHFYLKMRDVSGVEGTETSGHVQLRVARFSFHRKFLLVDDIWGPVEGGATPKSCGSWSPSDAQLDAWHTDVFAAMNDHLAPGDRPEHLDMFGPGDVRNGILGNESYLDTLGQYQTLIWSAAYPGVENGLMLLGRSRELAHYVGAGGNLLLLCYEGPVSAIGQNFGLGDTEEKCPSETFSLSEIWDHYSLLYQQFHLRACVDKPRGSVLPQDWWRFREATLIGARAERSIYPDLDLDWDLWDCTGASQPGGIMQYEVLWDDLADPDVRPWYEREDGLEVLYRSRTYAPGSRLDDRPIAWRTSATSEDRAMGISPGRIVVFAFHPYYFERMAVKSAMTLALEWAVTGRDY